MAADPDTLREEAGRGKSQSTSAETSPILAGDVPAGREDGSAVQTAPELEELRAILLEGDRQQLSLLAADLRGVRQTVGDRDALIATLTPVLTDAIRTSIRDHRGEMIEALYPIIGQLVVRAVAEAIRDFARSIDNRMRVSFSPRAIWRRLKARVRGVSRAELALRESLPFHVAEIFLIHRESGLLLRHISRDLAESPDSDLVSGMLTAIRDFVQDAFGRGQEGQLDEIQYGPRRIVIEASQHAYLAVVVDGVEPAGFRERIRDLIVGIEHRQIQALREYDGYAERFDAEEPALRRWLAEAPVRGDLEDLPEKPTSKRTWAAIAGLLGLCLALSLLVVWWVSRVERGIAGPAWVTVVATATPVPSLPEAVIPRPTATATAAPSATATATSTATATHTPTATPTASSTPQATPTQASKVGVKADVLNVRDGPGLGFDVIGTIRAGWILSVLDRDTSGTWLSVCCTADGQRGWVSADWVTLENR